ncbi:MAG: FtsW/RodA/SpoVE family cell cycle protein [Planctomycetes bacterium]|nr:FtsW/RodA/SpoVE family cell cycle protein [Planctomycetota bacterium]
MTVPTHGAVLRQLDWWLVLVATALSLVGLTFIHSATRYDPEFSGQHVRQALFLSVSAGLGLLVILVPYTRFLRLAWLLYSGTAAALLLLPWFGTTINGARRWYMLPGFAVQPAEFAKVAVIAALAAWLRFRTQPRWMDHVVVPTLITAVPALLVMKQPDLSSSLVFWPILLAMVYAGGASLRQLLAFGVAGATVVVLGYLLVLHDYQLERIEVWRQHFAWTGGAPELDPGQRIALRDALRGPAYQPWQALIAIGSGGVTGFGLGAGPQNSHDFLPYRNADYLFAVVAEETGLLGAFGLLGLQMALVLSLLRLAWRTRERFGRLLIVGVAGFLGAQSLMHVAVCSWLVPATGLPLPFLSYGGSSTMCAVVALALALNAGARRLPVLGGDGYR